MNIHFIVACDDYGGISKQGVIPWKCPDDMSFFKNKTINNVVVMGRKTFDSLPEKFRPLPGRTNVVMTKSCKGIKSCYRNKQEYFLVDSISSFMKWSKDKENIFVIGGSEIFSLFNSMATVLYLNIIRGNYCCDLVFPSWPPENFGWVLNESETKDNIEFRTYKKNVSK